MAEVPDNDVVASAKVVIKHHGMAAVCYASTRAEELFDVGDVRGAMVWRRVIQAIEQLQAMEPRGRVN